MSRLECIAVESADGDEAQEVVLMEPRPFKPFKSSEEYLVAMKEDLAEWFHRLYYPQLNIDFDNFMDVLEDGVALCKVIFSPFQTHVSQGWHLLIPMTTYASCANT